MMSTQTVGLRMMRYVVEGRSPLGAVNTVTVQFSEPGVTTTRSWFALLIAGAASR